MKRAPMTIAIATVVAIVGVSVLHTGCGKGEEEKPQIVDCHTVRYKNTDFTGICARGVRSYTTRITQTESGRTVTACFDVTCTSSGCIETVAVCAGGNSLPTAPSENGE